MLHNVSDATIRLAGWWFLAGWCFGFALALVVWWRPISRARHDNRDLRLLRLQLEDSDAQLTAAFKAADRLAGLLAEAKAGQPQRVA